MGLHGKVNKSMRVCPKCGGTGVSKHWDKMPKYGIKIQKLACAYYQKGLSLRKIAEKLNISHAQTVKNIINQ